MRALLAAALALVLVAAVAAPHVHAQATTTSSDECTLCTVRHAAPPPIAVPDVAPIVLVAGAVPCAPGLPPVFGAPLGSMPGQSPPPDGAQRPAADP